VFAQSRTLIPDFYLSFNGEILQNTSLNDEQSEEVCEYVGNLIVDEVENQAVWAKIEKTLSNYLKNNNIDQDPADLTDKIEWSVKVKLKK
jgi:hypothetical protein